MNSDSFYCYFPFWSERGSSCHVSSVCSVKPEYWYWYCFGTVSEGRMSHAYRQPVGAQPSVPVAQTPLPGRMLTPICTTGSPAVFPVMPNAYGLLPQQPQQFVTQPIVYPQSLQNVQNRVPFITPVPPAVPRMFMPVSAVTPGINTAAPDPAKLLEEQRRLEKERNFQLQQERLKQFTVAGKKGSINADNLIDSMFGKFQPKKSTTGSSSSSGPSIKTNEDKQTVAIVAGSEHFLNIEPSVSKQDISSNSVSSSIPSTVSNKKDKKELESMMLECSNLNVPSKAAKFQKPSIKEITPAFSQGITFSASEKSVDWRNIQGLDEVFSAPKPRFPSWCNKDKVPDLYKKIQFVVTNNNSHAPDTNLLFPILKSSGLSRELLGQIWELVNESASGQLTIEEMYAALALIAVAQAGHPLKTTDILHQLPSCPVPQLTYFTSSCATSNQSSSIAAVPPDGSSVSGASLVQQSKQSVHQIIRPTAISLASNSLVANNQKTVSDVTENMSIWKPFGDSLNTPDDEFDDFKSATPTAINFSLNTPSSVTADPDDDFDDFKQAPCIKAPKSNILPTVKPPEICVGIGKNANEPVQDLMSPEEDKYSVFRALQQNDDAKEWGDFTSVSSSTVLSTTSKEIEHKESSSSLKYPSVLVTQSTDSVDFFKSGTETVRNNARDDDEFGDFIHANVLAAPSSSTVTDFADFSNFKQSECEQASVSSQLDDEFGEFASSIPISLKPELGQEFIFQHLKDNISLAESQSVSSLELGTFDGGGGHSGESKSSLSRQGSIPSLDLKSVGLDGTDSEDCFTEIQLSPFVHRNSKSPSPVSNNTKGSDENESSLTPVGLVFQASLPLADKYSVIRQEKAKDEDQHISCWVRCLQSSVNILQNTRKIFNQMSCSSVCNEVLASEEGGNYVKNVIEVYKVLCRINLASKSVNKQTEAILDLLNEADQAWNTICGFFAGCALMPEEASLDFSSGILRPEPENNTKACGLCLLNVDLRSKSFKLDECPRLSYGGRNYHSTCANFWVNCVDPLLPALTLPQLL